MKDTTEKRLSYDLIPSGHTSKIKLVRQESRVLSSAITSSSRQCYKVIIRFLFQDWLKMHCMHVIFYNNTIR